MQNNPCSRVLNKSFHEETGGTYGGYGDDESLVLIMYMQLQGLTIALFVLIDSIFNVSRMYLIILLKCRFAFCY